MLGEADRRGTTASQLAVSIRSAGDSLGRHRHLPFLMLATGDPDHVCHTQYSEIDVVERK